MYIRFLSQYRSGLGLEGRPGSVRWRALAAGQGRRLTMAFGLCSRRRSSAAGRRLPARRAAADAWAWKLATEAGYPKWLPMILCAAVCNDTKARTSVLLIDHCYQPTPDASLRHYQELDLNFGSCWALHYITRSKPIHTNTLTVNLPDPDSEQVVGDGEDSFLDVWSRR